MLVDVDLCRGVLLIDAVLEGLEGWLITVFELAIACWVLLNGVIGQVHKGIVYVLEVDAELSAAHAQVALREH